LSRGAQNEKPQAEDNNNTNQKDDYNNQEVAIVMRGMAGSGGVCEFA
jgi:hypothetical protein